MNESNQFICILGISVIFAILCFSSIQTLAAKNINISCVNGVKYIHPSHWKSMSVTYTVMLDSNGKPERCSK